MTSLVINCQIAGCHETWVHEAVASLHLANGETVKVELLICDRHKWELLYVAEEKPEGDYASEGTGGRGP